LISKGFESDILKDIWSGYPPNNGYNQVKMAKENKENTTFISKWDMYAYNVMPFGLCYAPTTFQKMATKTF
jgi:hypothetical protein